jgi:hypothetical protein
MIIFSFGVADSCCAALSFFSSSISYCIFVKGDYYSVVVWFVAGVASVVVGVPVIPPKVGVSSALVPSGNASVVIGVAEVLLSKNYFLAGHMLRFSFSY